MKSKLVMLQAILLACIVCGCEIVDTKGNNQDPLPDKPLKDKDLYYSAVEYERGYDWRKDSLCGAVESRLCLYKNHQKLFSITLGPRDSDVAQADMHRIEGGNLYSFHNIGNRTAIRKNGEDFIYFDSQEYISHFVVADSVVYTLSSRPGHEEWRLRRNGSKVAEEENAVVIGDLYMDRGELCFAYGQILESSAGARQHRYYFVRDGQREPMNLLSTVTEVLAARRFGGVMNCLVTESNIDGVVWQQGEASFIINEDLASRGRDCSFFVAGDAIYAHAQVKTVYDDRQQFWNDYFWQPKAGSDSVTDRTNVSMQILSLCPHGKMLCYAASPRAASYPITVVHGGRKDSLDDNYRMVSPFALCCSSTRYCIGLNDAGNGYRPVVIDGQQTKEFDFNGYFTRFYLP